MISTYGFNGLAVGTESNAIGTVTVRDFGCRVNKCKFLTTCERCIFFFAWPFALTFDSSLDLPYVWFVYEILWLTIAHVFIDFGLYLGFCNYMPFSHIS